MALSRETIEGELLIAELSSCGLSPVQIALALCLAKSREDASELAEAVERHVKSLSNFMYRHGLFGRRANVEFQRARRKLTRSRKIGRVSVAAI